MNNTVNRRSETVVYDGDCGVCEASARWITARIPTVDVVSHHEYGLGEINAVWFVTDGNRLEGAPAVSALLLRARSRTLRMCGHLIGAPIVRGIAALVYSLVARNRQRLSRMLGLRACAVPNVATGTAASQRTDEA